ncbi:MAG: carboxypeptidase regulatory-like domain-containing protein, partial [Planctomycetota bacterium]
REGGVEPPARSGTPAPSPATRAEIAPDDAAAHVARAFRVRAVSAVDGAPVEGVEITLGRYLGASEYEESAGARSDAEGRATLPIPEGWDVRRITAWPTATTGWSRTFVNRFTEAQRAEELTLALASGGTFEGRVVDVDGRPVAGASVRGWCSPSIEGPPVRTATSGPDGAFRLEHVGPSFYVDAQREGYAIRSGFSGELDAGATAEDLEIVLDRARSLRGIVTDLEGRPLEGVRVRSDPNYRSLAQWHQTPYPKIRQVTGLLFRGTTDATGAFEVDAVPQGGNTRLYFRLAPFLEAYRDLDPTEGAHEVRLDPGLSAEGVVFDAAGAPAAGASVRRGPTFSNLHTAPTHIVADDGGRFRLDGLSRPDPTDEYEAPPYLVVKHAGHAVHVEQPIEIGPGAAPSTIRLDPELRLAGRVVDADGAPVEGASLRITGERRMNRGYESDFPASWVHVAGIDTATSAADGRFTFGQLPAGPYDLQLYAHGDRLRSRSYRVAAGAEDLELVLDERAMAKVVLRGRVTDARTGEPLGGFTVCPIRDGEGTNRAIADPNGRYEVSGLEAGPYGVVFDADGYSRFETALAEFAEGTHEVDAALWPEATLRFVIVDETGEALEGAALRAFDLEGEPLLIGTDRTMSTRRQTRDGRGVAHGLPARPITVEVEWRGDFARHAIDLSNPIEEEVELVVTRTPEPVMGQIDLVVMNSAESPAELRRRFERLRGERDLETMSAFFTGLEEAAPKRPVTLTFSSDEHRRRMVAKVAPLPSGEFEITERETDGLSGAAGPSMSSETTYTAPVPALTLGLPVGTWRVEVARDGARVAAHSIEVGARALDPQEGEQGDRWSQIPDLVFVTFPPSR